MSELKLNEHHIREALASATSCNYLTPSHTMVDVEKLTTELNARIAPLIAEVKKLREALAGLYGLVESGWLVRDTQNDSDENWARNQIEPVLKLKRAADALGDGNLKVAPLLEENAKLKAELELQREKNTRIKAIIDNEYAEGYEKNRHLIALLARARDTIAYDEDTGANAPIVKEIDAALKEKT